MQAAEMDFIIVLHATRIQIKLQVFNLTFVVLNNT